MLLPRLMQDTEIFQQNNFFHCAAVFIPSRRCKAMLHKTNENELNPLDGDEMKKTITNSDGKLRAVLTGIFQKGIISMVFAICVCFIQRLTSWTENRKVLHRINSAKHENRQRSSIVDDFEYSLFAFVVMLVTLKPTGKQTSILSSTNSIAGMIRQGFGGRKS